MKKNFRKFATILLSLVFTVFILMNPVTRAQGPNLSAQLLVQIRDNTNAIKIYTNLILARVNELPTYVQQIAQMALSWLDTTDNSNQISVNGTLMNLLNQSIGLDHQSQLSTSVNNTKNFFSAGTPDNANALSFSVFFNTPVVQTDNPDWAAWSKDYIGIVSGSNIRLDVPQSNWASGAQSQIDYYNLYNAISSVQSYNSYVISRLYAQMQKQVKFPKGIPGTSSGDQASTQDLLSLTMSQATSPDWFSQIGSESLGLVLRQILVYNSQTYVLLKQMVDYQQQILMAQAMGNTLLMQANIGNARLLYMRATGRV